MLLLLSYLPQAAFIKSFRIYCINLIDRFKGHIRHSDFLSLINKWRTLQKKYIIAIAFADIAQKSGRVSPNTETARGTSWFSIYKAFHPIPSNEVCQALNACFNLRTSNCPSFLAARYGYDQIRISYRNNRLSLPIVVLLLQ